MINRESRRREVGNHARIERKNSDKIDSDPGRGSLKISAFEQLDFLKRFWTGKLPVSLPDAIDKTKRITFLETSPNDPGMLAREIKKAILKDNQIW